MKTWMRRLAGLFGLGVLAAQGMVAHEVFVDSFGDAAQWPEVMNYENKLVLTVGAELASGGTGLRVSGAHLPDCDTAWNVRTARRPLTVKGAYFRLSFRLSSQTAVMVGKGDSQTWWTALRWFAADGEPLEPSRLSWSVSAGGPHEVVCLGRVPSGAAAYQLQLGYDLPNIVKGNVVTVSDVRLAVLDGVARGASDRGTDDLHPRVKLLTPSPTRNAHVPVQLALDGEFDIDWSRVKVVLDGADATERFVRTDGALVLTPSEPWTPGLHHVDVTAVDVFGQRTEAHKAFFLGEAPRTPRVTLRDDGMTLIDGVPFFPIGIYGVMRREFNAYDFDRACADLRQGGFNFIHSYASPHEDDFLDNAWKHGLRVWNVARMPDARFIDVERHHPAILAWYLGDDTSANTTVQQLEDYQDAVNLEKAVEISALLAA